MSTHLHSVLLSGVAGYIDAAGFASLIGLLPAHVTGEIVRDALAFSSGNARAHLMTRLWVLPVFVASIVIATLVARLRRRSGQRALTGLLALVTVALALFSASDALTHLLHQGAHWSFLVGGACAVTAMGFQNSLMRESLAASCPTTVMTGNLTHIVIEVVDHLFSKVMHPAKRDRRVTSRLGPVATTLMSFVACAVLGGFLTRAVGSLSVALPTLVTLVLTVLAWREDRKRAIARSPAVGKLSPAPLPSFDVWPEALTHRVPANTPLSSEASHAAAGASAQSDAERLPKRTISGTQLSQRFRDGK